MKREIEERRGKIMPDGKAMILAYDQGFEHGPRDFLENPESTNFEYILDIAKRGLQNFVLKKILIPPNCIRPMMLLDWGRRL